MARACSLKKNAVFKILTSKPTENSSLGRPRRRYKDNIRMNLRETSVNTGIMIDLAQNRGYWRALVNAALDFKVS